MRAASARLISEQLAPLLRIRRRGISLTNNVRRVRFQRAFFTSVVWQLNVAPTQTRSVKRELGVGANPPQILGMLRSSRQS